MKDTIIYLDVHGVVAEFVATTLIWAGENLRRGVEVTSWGGMWRLIDPDNPSKAADRFWREAEKDASIFANMPKCIWADDLVAELKKLGDVRFLSAGGPGACADGTIEFVRRHFDMPCLISHEKWRYADGRSILIDDSQDQICAWMNADRNCDLAYSAYEFPRPWNVSAENRRTHTIDSLYQWCGVAPVTEKVESYIEMNSYDA